MCGRFTNRYSWGKIVRLYRLTDNFTAPSNMPPRFNIAPTQNSLVCREIDGKRVVDDLRWGLLPFWAKSPGEGAKMINARRETVAKSPAFRNAFKGRPCLVIADGFYEWKVLGPKEKQPYHITTKDNAPFAFAGLWEPKTIADFDTFTIVTGSPNIFCADVHDRMPVILDPEDWDTWLAGPEERERLMRPFPAERMTMWPVGKAVGSPKSKGAVLVEPVGPTSRALV